MFDDIIEIVHFAAIKCNKVIFHIDGIRPNIKQNTSRFTCQELITLLSSPSISLSKIEFRDDNKVVSSQYVQNKLNLPKELFIK